MKVYDGTATEATDDSEADRVKVGIAEAEVATGDAVLTTSGLGSCLGVAVYDPQSRVAGLVHVMLPSRDDLEGGDAAKFADSGIEALVAEMERTGADRASMEAKVAGGSDMLDFSESGSGIGARNVERGRDTLDGLDIPVVGEDVGGEHGRSLRLESDSGDLVVKSADHESIRL